MTVGEDKTIDKTNLSITFISLFTSTGTLVCCALPALLVSIGAGATLAGLVSSAPWLIALSKYKVWTFGVSGIFLLIAGIALWRARRLPCPVDRAQAVLCRRLRQVNTIVYSCSCAIWLVGFFFAFVAVKIFY